MKKIVFVLLLAVFTSFAAWANKGKTPTANGKVIYKSNNGVEVTAVQTTDDKNTTKALHCKVTCKNGNTYECWVCSCKNIPCDNNGGGNQPK